jgi:hypothetical protein
VKAYIVFHGATAHSGPGPLSYRGFTISLRHTTLGKNPLDEWSARRRDLYRTTHNTHTRETSMSPVGFEHTIPANKRPPTHALNRAATGNGERIRTMKNHKDDLFIARKGIGPEVDVENTIFMQCEQNTRQYHNVKTAMTVRKVWYVQSHIWEQLKQNKIVLDFKLSPCSECWMSSSGWFTGFCSLNANVTEHFLFHLHRRVGRPKFRNALCVPLS